MDVNINLPCSSTSVGTAAQLFGLLIQTLIAAQCDISSPDKWPKDDGLKIDTKGQRLHYDFIVVGAGSAGSVVANRLSENSKWKVLLLEAGGNPPIESEIPSLSFAMFKTQYDWGYYAEKSNSFGLSTPQGIYWPRGKLLGGSSAINTMIYMRGNNKDYDNWRRMGNPGWGWEDLLYYFKKSEDNQNPAFIGPYHGSGGPLKVDYFPYTDPFSNIYKIASQQLGYPQVVDLTADTYVGYTYVQSTAYKGERWSAAKAFLSSVKDRKNLHIFKHAFVNKININSNNEVESVNFILNNTKQYTVNVRKEVILSAGAVNSPQILMLSGVGPENHLKRKGIDVIKSLPVGYNLKDHFGIALIFTLHKSTAMPVSEQETLTSIFQYLLFRMGPLSSGINFIGMVDSTDTNSTTPDLQLLYIAFRKQSPEIKTFTALQGYEEYIYNQIIDANQLNDLGIIVILSLRPESVGRIKLRSAKYDDKPKIYANYLTNPNDFKPLIRGIRKQLQFADTQIFKENEGSYFRISLSQCDKIAYDSDKYWECFIRNLGSTLYHPAGSVKMGPENDPTSVVNPRLQVKGIKNLRVADASIMPEIVSGNLNAPCMMIGEKAADFIKEDYL